MLPALIPPLITAGSTLLGSGMNVLGQYGANSSNRRLARQAQQHDIRMWNMQNKYNSPAAQMQRFKDAGLNTNLMYGQGSSGNASSAPSAHRPEMQSVTQGVEIPNMLSMMQQIADIEKTRAEAEQAKYQADFNDALRKNHFEDLVEAYWLDRKYGVSAKRQSFEQQEKRFPVELRNMRLLGTNYAKQSKLYDQDINLRKYQASNVAMDSRMKEAQINAILWDLENMKPQELNLLLKNLESKDLDLGMDRKLKPYFGSSSDPSYIRALHYISQNIFNDAKTIFGSAKKRYKSFYESAKFKARSAYNSSMYSAKAYW